MKALSRWICGWTKDGRAKGVCVEFRIFLSLPVPVNSAGDEEIESCGVMEVILPWGESEG